MAVMLTEKARIEYIKPGLWRTIDNLLIMLNNGKICIVPRYFLTDNITFISCDFADVRASHVHDVGCKYHQLVYVDLTLAELRKKGYLRTKQLQGNSFSSWICDDIPHKYLSVKRVTFRENNKIFKEVLQACGENACKTNVMYGAVHLNLGWLWSGKKKIDIYKFYGEEW